MLALQLVGAFYFFVVCTGEVIVFHAYIPAWEPVRYSEECYR